MSHVIVLFGPVVLFGVVHFYRVFLLCVLLTV